MEYKLLRKRRLGHGLIRETVSVKGNIVRHVQIETRNGLVFMRAKRRTVSLPARQ